VLYEKRHKMYNSLRERLEIFVQGPAGSYFKNVKLEDTQARQTQMYFCQLLMILAKSDDSVDGTESDLVEAYTDERRLTEKEQRDIQNFRFHRASRDEMELIIEGIFSGMELMRKCQLLTYVKEIVQNDRILSAHEEELTEILASEIRATDMRSSLRTMRRIKGGLRIHDVN